MEKDILIQNLKTKAGIDNLSDRTYDEVATAMLPLFADDDKITDDSWTVPVQMLKSMSGQLRHEVAEGIANGKKQWESTSAAASEKAIADAVAAAKAEWEKNNVTVPEKPADTPDVAQLVAEEVKKLTGEDSEFGKLSKQFSEYLKVQAEKEKAYTEGEMRSEILSYVMAFDGLDEDDNIVENVMLKLDIRADKEMATLKNEAKSLYEKAYKNHVAKHGGGNPFTGGAGESGSVVSSIEAWGKQRLAAAKEEEAAASELAKHIFK